MRPELPSKIHQFLNDRHTGVLSLVAPDGTPHAATVSYIVDGHFSLYFLSRPESRKARYAQERPAASLTVYDDRDLSRSAQIKGSISQLSEESRADQTIVRVIDRLWKNPQFLPTVYKIPGEGLAVLRLDVHEILWLESSDQMSPVIFRNFIVAR